MKRLFLLLFLVCTGLTAQQQQRGDSLLSAFRNQKNDSLKISLLQSMSDLKPESSLYYSQKGYELADSLSALLPAAYRQRQLIRLKAKFCENQAYYYEAAGDVNKCLEKLEAAKKFYKKGEDAKNHATIMSNMALIYTDLGNIGKALEYYEECLKTFEQLKYTAGIANCYNNLGYLFDKLNDHEKALENYQKAYPLWLQMKDKDGVATVLNNIAQVYSEMKSYGKALETLGQSLKIYLENSNQKGASYCYSNMALIFEAQGDLKKAMDYYQMGYAIRESIGDKRGVSNSLYNMGVLLEKQGNTQQARSYGERSLAIAQQIGYPLRIEKAAALLHRIYKKEGDYRKALQMHELTRTMHDSVINQENRKAAVKQQLAHEYEMRNTADSLQRAEEAKRNQMAFNHSLSRQKTLTYSGIAGIFLMMCVAAVSLNAYRQKKKSSIAISEQKLLIEHKQKEIVDSINYAKRIQEAILPAKELKYKIFPDAFVLFKPRDIVSGDFYWFAEKNGKRIIAVADCTGHGVPGAFMSMIGNAFLNEIVNVRGVTSPAAILDLLREQVITSLKQSGGENKDGMDISLLVFDDQQQIVEWAGANNPLWVIREGELFEYKPDKMPIGYFSSEQRSFNGHRIPFQKGDCFYLFSDGFADQFGGKNGKKFKYKPFKELLLSIYREEMMKQEETILKTFNDWKHNLEQIDDVCIIGIRV